MTAFSAAEEPHLTFVGGTELPEPPDGKVVLAFWALDLDRWHRFYFIVFIVNYSDLVFRALFFARHAFRGLNLSDIPTFAAFKLAARGHQHTLAFRAKHRIPIWIMLQD